jgi:hypothetical protein
MSGKADYEPAPGYEDKWHVIGSGSNPVWVGRKGDVPKLLSERFWSVYREWELFHLGLRVPEDETWMQEAVAVLEGHYRAHWSVEHRTLEQLHNIAQILAARRGR